MNVSQLYSVNLIKKKSDKLTLWKPVHHWTSPSKLLHRPVI